MTSICSEHSALLKRIAKNLNDRTARGVYADWLQERGEPAWYVVANYPVKLWMIYRTKYYWYKSEGFISLPWLEGEVEVQGSSPAARMKKALVLFAEGKAK